MKIVSLTICHYGADYIGCALRAVEPFVDEVYVLYTETPSHGTGTDLVCPDSKSRMYAAVAASGVKEKLKFIDGTWDSEHAHRDEIYKHVNQGDLIVVADADEVWDADNLKINLEMMKAHPTIGWYKVRMTNLWRSFNWACTDPMTQDRIIRARGGSEILYSSSSKLPERPDIWHFGYARKPIDIEYKMAIHGHVAEIFPEWYTEKFLKWTPNNNVTDCHPACRDFWFPKPFDKNLLPSDLHLHPYAEMDIIA